MAQRCDRCHGVNGNSTDPRAPALASQRADYLEKVLRAYQKGERKSTAMTAMLDGLSDADIEALAAHYSRQQSPLGRLRTAARQVRVARQSTSRAAVGRTRETVK